MTLKKIECHSIDEHTKALADYLPGGPLFAAKNIAGTVMRDMLKGISRESVRAEAYLKALQEEFIPDKTNNFLDDWERVLAIPDDCFDGQGTNGQRRQAILIKLASLGVQTAEDFENLALLFGITVSVIPGAELFSFPLTFPFLFFTTEEEARFTIVITFTVSGPSVFPFTFPIVFGNREIAILECLFRKLKPANCEVIFQQI